MSNKPGCDLLDGILENYQEKEIAGAAKENDMATINLVLFLFVLMMIALVFLLPYH